VKAFITISTDEVYGQILQGSYDESAPINPRNPYAASKAGADAITLAYHHTYGMWTAVTRTENNYGPYQHPQKAIPTFFRKAMRDEPLPVYGDGKHVRQWLHVSDHVDALCKMIAAYKSLPPGEVWHVAGQQELTNAELAASIISLTYSKSEIEYIDDHDVRPGHDRRYSLSCDKMEKKLQWKPAVGIELGLISLYKWYLGEGKDWVNL
jgi:dTDP-glucose 4,6-dehydratase